MAAAFRRLAPAPWLHLSIDHLRDSGAWDPGAYANWAAARPAFFAGFHAAVAGFLDAGNDVILEHIMDTPGWHADLQNRFAGHRVLFVGLHADLSTLVQREAARGDRALGSAARDHAGVHTGMCYDLELTGTDDPALNARHLLQAVATMPDKSRFFAPPAIG